MLKQGSFVNKRFNRLFWGDIWGWLAYCINMMTDSLISGNQLGEVSLQAVSIVFPLFSVAYFFSYLVSPGSSIIFGKRIGEFEQEEAYRVAGTSFISSIVSGILIAVGLCVLKEPFLNYYQCTGMLYTEASAYYNWVILYASIFPLETWIYYLSATDGAAATLSAACIVEIVSNVVLSIKLSQTFGISGLGMATCIGLLLKTIVFALHFLKKSNNVKIRACLDVKYVTRSLVLGFSRYTSYLFMAIVDIVLNKIIINTSGVELIPAYVIVNLVFGFCEMFGALNDAGMGLITCFLGEKNNHDMNFVFRKIGVSMLIVASVITVFFFFAAPLMPIIFGLATPITIEASVMTSRIMAFTALGYGACYLSSEISCDVEKPLQACFICFLYDVVTPLLLTLIFGSLWGFTGLVIAMCLSTYLAFGLYMLIRIPRKGKAGFPIYVEDFGADGYSYDLYVSKESVPEVRDAVCAELVRHGYNIENIDLLIEEFFTRIMEKNPGKKVFSECTLLFSEDSVKIIIRDDGVLFNFVDENNKIESLNAHVLNSLLEQTEQKNYLITTSFNRNGFIFEK